MYTIHTILSSPTNPASTSRTHHVNVLLLRSCFITIFLLIVIVSFIVVVVWASFPAQTVVYPRRIPAVLLQPLPLVSTQQYRIGI